MTFGNLSLGVLAAVGWVLFIAQLLSSLDPGFRKKVPTIRRFIYWKLNAKGAPEPDFTGHETMHLYGHVHLVEIPIPEDVLQCMHEFEHPSPCLILDKFGKPQGSCRESESKNV